MSVIPYCEGLVAYIMDAAPELNAQENEHPPTIVAQYVGLGDFSRRQVSAYPPSLQEIALSHFKQVLTVNGKWPDDSISSAVQRNFPASFGRFSGLFKRFSEDLPPSALIDRAEITVQGNALQEDSSIADPIVFK